MSSLLGVFFFFFTGFPQTSKNKNKQANKKGQRYPPADGNLKGNEFVFWGGFFALYMYAFSLLGLYEAPPMFSILEKNSSPKIEKVKP